MYFGYPCRYQVVLELLIELQNCLPRSEGQQICKFSSHKFDFLLTRRISGKNVKEDDGADVMVNMQKRDLFLFLS
jgi:hypothetical protein